MRGFNFFPKEEPSKLLRLTKITSGVGPDVVSNSTDIRCCFAYWCIYSLWKQTSPDCWRPFTNTPISKSINSSIPTKLFRPIAFTSYCLNQREYTFLSRLISSADVPNGHPQFVHKPNEFTWDVVASLIYKTTIYIYIYPPNQSGALSLAFCMHLTLFHNLYFLANLNSSAVRIAFRHDCQTILSTKLSAQDWE